MNPVVPNWLPISLCLALAALRSATAQEGLLPSEHHPWGRFPVGSWKLVRVVTETLDPLGNVTSTTINETRTTLIAADATTYTLRVETTVEAAGRKFAQSPRTLKMGYRGEAPGEQVAAKKTGTSEVVVNGRKIPCDVHQIQIDGQNAKYTGTLCYAPAISPYVLRKEGTAAGQSAGNEVSTTVEVLALAMPYRVLGDLRTAAYLRTVEKKSDRTATTVEVQCDDVPGGEVAHSSRDQNAEAKTLRRSTLELLDYHVGNDRAAESWGGRRRVLHRNRPRRGDDGSDRTPRR